MFTKQELEEIPFENLCKLAQYYGMDLRAATLENVIRFLLSRLHTTSHDLPTGVVISKTFFGPDFLESEESVRVRRAKESANE